MSGSRELSSTPTLLAVVGQFVQDHYAGNKFSDNQYEDFLKHLDLIDVNKKEEVASLIAHYLKFTAYLEHSSDESRVKNSDRSMRRDTALDRIDECFKQWGRQYSLEQKSELLAKLFLLEQLARSLDFPVEIQSALFISNHTSVGNYQSIAEEQAKKLGIDFENSVDSVRESSFSKLFNTEEKSKQFKVSLLAKSLLAKIDKLENLNGILAFLQTQFGNQLNESTDLFFDLKRYNDFIDGKWTQIIQEKLDEEFPDEINSSRHTSAYLKRSELLKTQTALIDKAFATLFAEQKKVFFSNMINKYPLSDLLSMVDKQPDETVKQELFDYLTRHAPRVFEQQIQFLTPQNTSSEIQIKLDEFKRRNPKLVDAKKRKYAEEMIQSNEEQEKISAQVTLLCESKEGKQWIKDRADNIMDKEKMHILENARREVNDNFIVTGKLDILMQPYIANSRAVEVEKVAQQIYSKREVQLPKNYFEYHQDPATQKGYEMMASKAGGEGWIASLNKIFIERELPELKKELYKQAVKEAEDIVDRALMNVQIAMREKLQNIPLQPSDVNLIRERLSGESADLLGKYNSLVDAAYAQGHARVYEDALEQAYAEYEVIARNRVTNDAIVDLKKSKSVGALVDNELIPRIFDRLREEKMATVESDVARGFVSQIERLIKSINWETGFLKTGFGGTKIELEDGAIKKVPKNVAKIHAEYKAALKDNDWTKHLNEIVSIARSAAAKPGLFGTRRQETQAFYDKVAKIEPRGRSK